MSKRRDFNRTMISDYDTLPLNSDGERSQMMTPDNLNFKTISVMECHPIDKP